MYFISSSRSLKSHVLSNIANNTDTVVLQSVFNHHLYALRIDKHLYALWIDKYIYALRIDKRIYAKFINLN